MKTILALLCVSAVTIQAATQITWKRQQLHADFYSEGAAIGDINGDGKPDIVVGPFWWEGPAFEKKHAYYEPKIFSINGYSDNFFAYVHDFNADQKNDILILGFPGKEARLYLNPGTHDDKPWPMHIVADVVDNESPVFTDITGDGNPEIVCSTGGKFGWFAPNWEKPTEKWPFIAVTDDLKVAKFTHGLGVGDVDGDGKMDLLEARRWWENKPGRDKWEQHNFAAGVGGGAQMFAYDFDGNGTNDVFTALAAHRYGVAVFLQNKPAPDKPTWQRVMLASEQPQDNDYGIVFSQPHAAFLADIDGDGVQDIVTGKRYWAHNGHDPDERGHRVIYWYQTKRDGKGGVDFVPHLIDSNTGVGVDVQVGDVNGDKLPDIVVGNKAGVFILTQERKDTTADLTPKKLYGPALKPQAEYAKGQSPADALKSMQLPGGFKAELIAAEPDLVQPMAFTFDERGRIWVVEGNSYPKPREVGQGQDRIKILEDKDGDGTFETKKVFCEGLNLVSGIELGFGGVWVGAAPYLMFIPDKDRNDQPDPADPTDQRPKVPGLNFTAYALLDGWGSQDTHETLNSFIWGPDGWLYGCHGVFTHSRVGKPGAPDDQRKPINAGIWRYHPVRHEFEVFAEGTSNPWGLDYDQHGEFFVTACVIPHLYHIVPGGRYQRQAGQHFNAHTYDDIKTIADHAHYAGNPRPDVSFNKTTGAGVMNNDTNALGGGHAHCGLAIYQSSHFPPTYRNQLIFGNLHGHRLVANYTDPHASTYIGKHAADFLRANDMHFIPVTQKVGPDGALYVSDWSDQQICHRGSGAVEHWDRSNGRLYRISYDGWKPWKGDLAMESDGALAKLAVQTENEWESRMARRVLMESTVRNPSRFDQLEELWGRQFDSNSLSEIGKLRGFWLTHSTHGASHTDSETRFSWAVTPNVGLEDRRAASIRFSFQATAVASLKSDEWLDQLRPFVEAAKTDASPIVRRELASALQRLPQDQRKDLATALLKHGEDKDDPMIPLLIWYGIEPLVGEDAEAGIQLARGSKIPKVTDFIYRRLAAEPAGRLMLLRNLVKPAETQKPAAEGGKKVLWREKLDVPREQKVRREDFLSPGSEQLLPPTEKKVSSSEQLVPSREKKVSRRDFLIPGREQKVPSTELFLPQNSQLVPRNVQLVAGQDKEGIRWGLLADLEVADRERILEQVVQQARQAGRQQPPADWAELSAALRAGASPRFSTLLDELSALFGDTTALGEFRATLADAKRTPVERQAALSLLIQAGDAGTAKVLQGMLADTTTPGGLRRQALQALASLKDSETPQILGALLPKLPANELPDAINTLASTKEGAKALLKAVEAKTVPRTALSPFLVRQLTAFDDAEIAALIKSAWGDVNAPKADMAERVKKYRDLLTPAALAKGDAAKGKMMFMATCGACHKLFGEGQNVGPDITGSNRADLGYLLENVLDPNAVIGKDYQLNLFTMKDGRVMSGVIKAESAAAVKIAMMGGVEFTLPVADIAKREVSKLSTMPEGLFDALPPEMVVDLVKYLQSSVVRASARPDGLKAELRTVEGALEGETLKVIAKTGGNTRVQGMGGFGNRWSGGSQLWWIGGQPNQKLTLALPVKEAGKYTLKAVLTMARDYGMMSISLDGKPVASTFDGYHADKVILTDELDWGTHELSAGDHELTFTLAPPNPAAAPGNMVGLDYVKLERK
jgi:putative membrane-bound dehydrogenase-like protein